MRALARGLPSVEEIAKPHKRPADNVSSMEVTPMNLQRRPTRILPKHTTANARTYADHGDLLPWADPYIASLIREHERQMRLYGDTRRRRE
jgi:hypothetical protein